MKQEESKHFSFRKRLASFGYALQGIKLLVGKEHNAQIHCCATILVCIAGWVFHISVNEWISIVLAIGIVLTAEAFNTAIEKIADFISPERHPAIKEIKDIAAGGVLFTAIAAAITGLIIFLPKVILFVKTGMV